MTDEMTVFGGNVKMKSSAELAAAMAEVPDDTPAGEGGAYISFSGKSGKYAIGDQKRDTDPDELFVVNIHDLKRGWMCWKGSKPVAKRFANHEEPQIATPDMTEFSPFGEGEGWAEARAMSLISGENKEQYFFSTSSVSGVRAFKALKDMIMERAKRGDPAWAVFSLSSETFRGQGYDIPKPKFDIEGWIDDDNIGGLQDSDLMDLVDASSGVKAVASPAKGKEKKAVASEAAEVEDEAPTRRRRRTL